MIARVFRVLILFLGLFGAVGARAQYVPPETLDSIDARVLNAKTVVVGRVVEVSEPVPHGRYRQRDVTLRVETTLKGKAPERLRFTPLLGDDVLQGWKARAARLLVDVPSRPDDFGFRHVTVLDEPGLAAPTADFTVLREPEAVVAYVRALVQRKPKVDSIETFALGPPEGPDGDAWRRNWPGRGIGPLRVPADERLERRARDRLGSASKAMRVGGASALRFFPSPENTERLRPLLGDPDFDVKEQAETNNGVERRAFPVRAAAYETLRAWGEKVAKPAVEEDVSRLATLTSLYWNRPLTDADLDAITSAKGLTQLSLSYSRGPFAKDLTARLAALSELTELTLPPLSVQDADLPPLLRLAHLRLLRLDGNPITDAGAKALVGFPPSLQVVGLEQTEMTDAGLDALRATRAGLRVLPDTATSIVGVYVDRLDVAGLRRRLDAHPEEANRKSTSGGMPLHQAAESYGDSLAVVRLLLERGASLVALDWAGRMPLQTAIDAIKPSTEVVRLLLEKGSDPDYPDTYGNTPLERATIHRSPEIVRLLLAAGADPLRFSKERLRNADPCPKCLDLIARAAAKKARP